MFTLMLIFNDYADFSMWKDGKSIFYNELCCLVTFYDFLDCFYVSKRGPASFSLRVLQCSFMNG